MPYLVAQAYCLGFECFANLQSFPMKANAIH